MPQSLGYVALLVHDYDEALAYFTEKLGFHLVEDSPSTDRNGEPKRWVLIAPPGLTRNQSAVGQGVDARGNQPGR